MDKFNPNLLIHQKTNDQIVAFINQPSHALLLIGASGKGKYTLAKAIAAQLLGIEDYNRLGDHPYYSELAVAEGKQDIPIDDVRKVIKSLRLKTPGTKALRRIVVIDGAHNLSGEAQNSLLKTLEEPGLDTAFILTAPSVKALAPTIASRGQSIIVYAVTRADAIKYYKDRHAEADIASNWLLSAGAAGLLSSLLDSEAEHPLKNAVSAFKRFLGATTYERLLQCESLARDKVALANFLDGGTRVLRALHHSSLKNASARRSIDLTASRKLLNSLQNKLAANASPRLVALALALNLKL